MRSAFLVWLGIVGGNVAASYLDNDGAIIVGIVLTAVGYYCLGTLLEANGTNARIAAFLRKSRRSTLTGGR